MRLRRRIEFDRMDASAQSFARLRGFALSAEAFRRLALASAVMLILIVATGATVRLTGSGLGCEHWPGCEPHHFEPKSYHSYIEFGNRVFAFLTILVTLVTWIAAPRGLRLLAFGIFAGTLLQAPLGALTVHFHLNPWLVLSHFLLSVVVLTFGVILALEAGGGAVSDVPRRVRRFGLLVGAAACVLVVSGTLATAAGPHPGSTVVRRLGSFQPAVYWHVRATAVFGLVVRAAPPLARPQQEPACAGRARAARSAAAADDRRRGAVPHASSLVARDRPRDARRDRVGGRHGIRLPPVAPA